jgi:hypothetical protein
MLIFTIVSILLQTIAAFLTIIVMSCDLAEKRHQKTADSAKSTVTDDSDKT